MCRHPVPFSYNLFFLTREPIISNEALQPRTHLQCTHKQLSLSLSLTLIEPTKASTHHNPTGRRVPPPPSLSPSPCFPPLLGYPLPSSPLIYFDYKQTSSPTSLSISDVIVICSILSSSIDHPCLPSSPSRLSHLQAAHAITNCR